LSKDFPLSRSRISFLLEIFASGVGGREAWAAFVGEVDAPFRIRV
jgi:hypothetical protein